MGFLDEESVLTPRLDQFAKESRVLNQAASNFPVCSPYRAMFMTGQYPTRNGVVGNCNSRRGSDGYELRSDARCWSDVLADAGYSLGYIGKWHLDNPYPPYIDCSNNEGHPKWNEWCPPERRHGFDYWYSYGTYDQHTRPMYWRNDAARGDFHYVDQWGPEHEADEAIRYFENENNAYRDPDQPFALVVSMNPPHMPYELVPKQYVERYAHLSDEELGIPPNVDPAGTVGGDYFRQNQRNQLAMITGVDEQFGRILDALDKNRLSENTLVIFTSDHGDMLGRHYDVFPFEMNINKPSPFDSAMRVPFLLRFPGRVAPGSDGLLLSTPDIYPTMLDLLGLDEAISDCVQGSSLAPALRDEDGAYRPDYQLYAEPGDDRPKGIRDETHTFVVWIDEKGVEQQWLYDRSKDPYQIFNYIKEQPGKAAEMREALGRLLAAYDEPWIGLGRTANYAGSD